MGKNVSDFGVDVGTRKADLNILGRERTEDRKLTI